MLALLREPGAWAALAAGELDAAAVALEGVRIDPPLIGMFRTVTRDVTLADAAIGAGERVLLLFGSGSHHEAVVDEPAAFRPGRPGKVHLGFGYGTHNCLGAPLAKLELEVALRALAERFPQLRLASDEAVVNKPLMQVRSPAQLWLSAD